MKQSRTFFIISIFSNFTRRTLVCFSFFSPSVFHFSTAIFATPKINSQDPYSSRSAVLTLNTRSFSLGYKPEPLTSKPVLFTMAELQKFIQASNGAFKSDLMKTFVAKHRGDFSPSSAVPGFIQNVTTTTGGAGIFSTTTTTTGTTGIDTTDNANILLQKNLTDNNSQTSNTTTTDSTSVIDNKAATTTPIILQPAQDNGNNESNVNANVNRNVVNVASPEQPDTNANVSEVNAILEEVRAPMTETRQMLVQQVTDATVDAHMATCMNTYKAVEEATARFMAMKEAGQLVSREQCALH